MNITHRSVEEKDLAVICTFPQSEEELFYLFPKASFPLTPEQLSTAINARSDSTVAVFNGAVAGFANFYHWKSGETCSIGNVIVAPAVRGQGVGRYLIEQMIELAVSKHNAREVRISCFNRNIEGLLLYSKLGFEPYSIEEREGKKRNRTALIHMRLQIDRTRD